MLISFGWTAGALLAWRKTCTRRDWVPSSAAKHHAGDVMHAYDKSPRFKGQHIADIRLRMAPALESMENMPDRDYEAEGFAWLHEHPEAVSPSGRAIFGDFSFERFEAWRASGASMWVIRFEVTAIHETLEAWLARQARPALVAERRVEAWTMTC